MKTFPSSPRLKWVLAAAVLSVASLRPAAAADAASTKTPPSLNEIIAKARAYMGSEDKLMGVGTLKFSGNMYDDKGEKQYAMNMIFLKPDFQRNELTTADGNGTIIKGTNGLVGWMLAQNNKSGARQLFLMPAQDVEQFMDGGYETMYFFRGPKQVPGGDIKFVGPANFRGKSCWEVSYSYPDGTTLNRYFEVASGALVGTRNDAADTDMVESGKITSGEIDFPAQVDYYKANKLFQTLKYSKIIVNEPVESWIFPIPANVDGSISAPPLGAHGDQPAPAGAAVTPAKTSALPPVLLPSPKVSAEGITTKSLTPSPEEQPTAFVVGNN